MGEHERERRRVAARRGDEAVVHVVDELGDHDDVGGGGSQRVEGRRDPALDGVLQRCERAVDPPVLHREDDVVVRGQGDELVPRAPPRPQQRLVRVGALGAEEPDATHREGPRGSGGAGASVASRSASSSSGESWRSGTPATTCLA